MGPAFSENLPLFPATETWLTAHCCKRRKTRYGYFRYSLQPTAAILGKQKKQKSRESISCCRNLQRLKKKRKTRDPTSKSAIVGVTKMKNRTAEIARWDRRPHTEDVRVRVAYKLSETTSTHVPNSRHLLRVDGLDLFYVAGSDLGRWIFVRRLSCGTWPPSKLGMSTRVKEGFRFPSDPEFDKNALTKNDKRRVFWGFWMGAVGISFVEWLYYPRILWNSSFLNRTSEKHVLCTEQWNN